MPSPVRTYSERHLAQQQALHARSDGYGRHRHVYLHDLIRRLAGQVGDGQPADENSWLDYGCGKGGFIEQIRPLGLFGRIVGYDPAVRAFAARPTGCFNLVTCLDVLDITEARFLDKIIADIAGFTAGVAVIDCLTRPSPQSLLTPHAPFYWNLRIRQHMEVTDTRVEFPGMEGFERAVITARPLPA